MSLNFFAESAGARERHRQSMDVQRDFYAGLFTARIEKALEKQFKKAAEDVKRSGDAEFPLDNRELFEIIEFLYIETGQFFAGEATRQIALQKDHGGDESDHAIFAYIRDNVMLRILGMADYTRRIINGIVTEGKAENIGNAVIADRIIAWFDEHGETRAETVATGEAINASNMGADSGFEAADSQLGAAEREARKRWNTRLDGLQRDSHGAANGQDRKRSDVFNVGSSILKWPGDSSLGAGPEETANCRCALTYRFV